MNGLGQVFIPALTMQKPWKGAAGAGTHCSPLEQPDGLMSTGSQATACVVHCAAGRTTEAAGWHVPPLAVDPEIVMPTPVPHPVVALCRLVHMPGGVLSDDPQFEVQPPVPNCTLTELHAAPEGGLHEHEHCAASAERPLPPSKYGR